MNIYNFSPHLLNLNFAPLILRQLITIQRLREITSELYNGCGKFQAKQCHVSGKLQINFVSKVLVIFPRVGLDDELNFWHHKSIPIEEFVDNEEMISDLALCVTTFQMK